MRKPRDGPNFSCHDRRLASAPAGCCHIRDQRFARDCGPCKIPRRRDLPLCDLQPIGRPILMRRTSEKGADCPRTRAFRWDHERAEGLGVRGRAA